MKTETDYTIVKDVSLASHWIAYQDEKSCVKDYIIPGKKYELIKLTEQWDNGEDEEYFILSEDGYYSMYYMAYKGEFIILNNLNKHLN